MTVEIMVPSLGESVTEATVAKWLKQPGDRVAIDDPVVELETDKATLEIAAPAAGTLTEIHAAEGADVPVGAVLGTIADGGGASSPHLPVALAAARRAPGEGSPAAALGRTGPAARKLIEETGLEPGRIAATGPDGRITKGDVIAARSQPAVPAPLPVSYTHLTLPTICSV